MKLLSILIPTFNRANYLNESLSTIVPQIKKYEEYIDFAISDNASTDETEDVVKKYSTSVTIRYTKNESNIGYVGNFQQLLSNAEGQYIYLMGDDDIVAPDFIDIVVNLLKSSKDYSLIHWNRLSCDEKCQNGLLVDGGYEMVEWRGSSAEFIMKIMDNANFISSIIFHRECWALGGDCSSDYYLGYDWFVRLYKGSLLHNKTCLYYYFPLVLQRNPSKSWVQYWPQYCISSLSNIFFELDAQIPGLYKKWSRKLRKETLKCLPLVGMNRNYYRKKEVKKLILNHLTFFEKIWYYVFLIPGLYSLLKVMLRIVR